MGRRDSMMLIARYYITLVEWLARNYESEVECSEDDGAGKGFWIMARRALNTITTTPRGA